jgi:surface polysaccharide O-acyltransferase-like enzyme
LVLLYPAYRIAVARPELGIVVVLCLWAKLNIDQWAYATLGKTVYIEYLVRLVKILTYGGYGVVAASFYGVLQRGFSAEDGRQLFGTVLLAGIILYMVKLLYAYQIIMTGTWAFNFEPGFWGEALMPPVLFLAVMSLRHKAWPAAFTPLATFCFGIYLTHPIVMDATEIMIAPWGLLPWQMVALKFSLSLTGALILVNIIARIPLLSWTIGINSLPRPPAPIIRAAAVALQSSS